jgi:VanZ family protein
MPRKSLTDRGSLWAPPIAYMIIIFTLSAQPDPVPALTERFWDKTLHFVGYAGLCVLFCRAFAGERVALAAALVCAFVATSAYGASDEFHQSFTPGRSASILDWVADTVGAGLGVAGYLVWSYTGRSRQAQRPAPQDQ